MVSKSAAAKKFMADMLLQIPGEFKDLRLGALDDPLAAIVVIYYASRRPDLDGHAIMDTLEHAGIVSNDRYIREKHMYGFLDPDNPRAEVYLFRIPDVKKIQHPLEDKYGSF